VPRKTWAAGDVLTATDLMEYLMDQAVVVCTSGTRPSSPDEGQAIYETDTNAFRIQVDGAWSTIPRLEAANSFAAVVSISTGGLNVGGSPSGYVDEVRFTSVGGSGTHALSTVDTGTPQTLFDHRGSGNAGLWKWRNGTAAADERMTLTATGELHTASGLITGGNIESGGDVESAGIVSAVVTGGNNVSFQDNDNHSWESDGSGGWRFANRWSTAAALFKFVGGDDTIELLRVSDPGAVDDTALSIAWIWHDGTHSFKRVRASQAGDVDGTSRRYLYVVES
jgi:hypothetical protein